MQRTVRITYVQSIAMFGLLAVLILLDSLTLEFFFFSSFIVFLVLSELTSLSTVIPRWRTRLWWFIAIGLAGLGYLVIRRILVIL